MPEAREFRSNRPQEFALTGLGICVGAAAWPGRHAPGSSRGATAGPRICRSVPAFDLGPLQFGNQACLLELHNGTEHLAHQNCGPSTLASAGLEPQLNPVIGLRPAKSF
jgi:hypothetical protein